MKNTKKQKNKGFTLIEMLVSTALFSIVLVIAIGSIMTIIDTNRKSQTLTLVMNNLNFALESMTRTIKTATKIDNDGFSYYFKEQYDEETGIGGDWVSYRENNGTIERCKKSDVNCTDDDFIPIISSSVEINEFEIEYMKRTSRNQWRIFIVIDGIAQLSPRISSDFSVQTTISPRNLNI